MSRPSNGCWNRERAWTRRSFLAATACGVAAATLRPRAGDAFAPAERSIEDLSDVVAEELKGSSVPAAATAVLVDGELRALGAAGVRKRGVEARVGVDDKFHLGSCTKAMTATLVGKLIERGELDWTTTVRELFPNLKIHEGYRDVTVRQLLSHVGGAPHDVDRRIWRRVWNDRDLSPRESRDVLVEATLAAPPHEEAPKFLYSNSGYSIVGAAIERRFDVPFESLLRREIFEPLGMASAGFGAPAGDDAIDQPWGHDPDPVAPRPFGDNPPAIGPGGTVHASMRDWARFVRLHLTGLPPDLVNRETLEVLHSPIENSDGYALGWRVLDRPWSSGKILMHNGTNRMNFAVAWLAPKERFGVIAACNQGGDEASDLCDALSSYAVRKYA